MYSIIIAVLIIILFIVLLIIINNIVKNKFIEIEQEFIGEKFHGGGEYGGGRSSTGFSGGSIGSRGESGFSGQGRGGFSGQGRGGFSGRPINRENIRRAGFDRGHHENHHSGRHQGLGYYGNGGRSLWNGYYGVSPIYNYSYWDSGYYPEPIYVDQPVIVKEVPVYINNNES